MQQAMRLVVMALGFAVVAAASAQEIVEFPIPGPYSASGIAVGPDGEIWFTENEILVSQRPPAVFSIAGPVAQITTGGVITEDHCSRFEGVSFSGIGGPATIPGGNLWITQYGLGMNGTAVEIAPCLMGAPGSIAALPGTYPATSLIAGPDGNLWFALSLAVPPLIGRSTASGLVTTFTLPAGTTPAFLAAGPDGNIWFTDSANAKVGRITTSGSVTLFDLSNGSYSPAAITAGPDGNLWFIEQNNQIGRMTTEGALTEYRIPTPASGLFDITAGADGAMWFTESAGKVGRITTAGAISEIRVPYANASPHFIVGKPDGTIWFTDSRGGANGVDRIGRLSPAAGCASDPQTLCLNIGAFSVTASFQSTPEGPSTPASAVPLTDNTGYFWFFDPANVEMVVKVLDGCDINGNYWVFAGGLTNVGVDWTVTRTQTNAVKNYSNPSGTAFQPVQDTAAFPCP